MCSWHFFFSSYIDISFLFYFTFRRREYIRYILNTFRAKGERERDRERQTERQRERDRERETEKERRETEREKERRERERVLTLMKIREYQHK